MNKRGQFFLIAALVIAGIIITLTTINISTKTPETKTTAVYDLSKEIDYESGSLIDYGIFKTGDPSTSGVLIDSLIANYSAANPDTDLVFIYGSSGGDTLTATSYYLAPTASSRWETATFQSFEKEFKQEERSVTNNQVNVTLPDNSTIFFDLNPGENFFIVLRKEVGGETIVATE